MSLETRRTPVPSAAEGPFFHNVVYDLTFYDEL